MHTQNDRFNQTRNDISHSIRSLRVTPQNMGWWLLSFLILLLIIGGIRTWFVPDANYFDPIIGIINTFFNLFGSDIDSHNFPTTTVLRKLATGASLTLIISLLSVIIGFCMASILAIILVQKGSLYGLKYVAEIYVDFFRSTPLLVQILLVYFGLPDWITVIINLFNSEFLNTEVFAGMLALTMNTTAYQAEIIRGGILAIPTGQLEASRALGMTSKQTMFHVILPQAFRIIVPSLTNELINVILNSSLISSIGVFELTKRAQELQSYYFLWQIFFIAAIYYFIIAYSLSKLTKRLERKLRIPGLGVSHE